MKIFISGASKGLGFYLTKELLIRQHMVWGIGRSPLQKENLDFPLDRFTYTQCDTTSYEQTKSTFDEMVKSDFIPDIAIFCAGNATEDIVNGDFKIGKFKANFDVNLLGALNWVEFFLPLFIKRNKGTFVGISSMSIYRETRRRRVGYSASKVSLNKAFENLRLEYLDAGIKFGIFNIGRMNEKEEFIGISYAKATRSIVKILQSGNIQNVTNLPFLQWLLTKMIACVPDKIYYKYFYKHRIDSL